MPECVECGGHVSHRFSRVMGDRSGECICPECKAGAYAMHPFVLGWDSDSYRRVPP